MIANADASGCTPTDVATTVCSPTTAFNYSALRLGMRLLCRTPLDCSCNKCLYQPPVARTGCLEWLYQLSFWRHYKHLACSVLLVWYEAHADTLNGAVCVTCIYTATQTQWVFAVLHSNHRTLHLGAPGSTDCLYCSLSACGTSCHWQLLLSRALPLAMPRTQAVWAPLLCPLKRLANRSGQCS
jgi:hypothetical protein